MDWRGKCGRKYVSLLLIALSKKTKLFLDKKFFSFTKKGVVRSKKMEMYFVRSQAYKLYIHSRRRGQVGDVGRSLQFSSPVCRENDALGAPGEKKDHVFSRPKYNQSKRDR